MEDQYRAIRNYNIFQQLPSDRSATIEKLVRYSAGVRGYLDSDPDALINVGKGAVPNHLCGLGARTAISAVADFPEWERIVFTVDSGASEIVVPPGVALNLPLIHTRQLGTEYEVANGGVVVNLGKKRTDIITKIGSTTSMILSFQVAKCTSHFSQ